MKLYKNIIIIVVVLGLLTGGLIIVNKLPKKDNAPQKNPQQTEEEQPSAVEYIDIFSINSEDITKITVQKDAEEYSVKKNGNEFVLSDSEGIKINKSSLSSFVSLCSYLYADKVVSENPDDTAIYELDKPVSTTTIHLKDGSTKVLRVGKSSIDGKSNYFKVDGDDKIYLKGAYSISTIAPDYNSFIDLKILTINPTDYASFNHININKKNSTETELVAVRQGSGDEEKIICQMSKPVHAEANSIVLSQDILTPLSELTVSGVVEAKVKDLGKYGLDTPYAVFRISIGGVEQKLTVGNELNGYRFLMIDDYKTVYMTDSKNLAFLDLSYIDLMSRLVHTENIKYVSKVEVNGLNHKYTLEINGDDKKVNGVSFGKSDFSKFYRTIIEISFDSVDINAVPGSMPDVTIKYTMTDGRIVTVSYVPYNDRNYLALVDGKGNSIVKKESVIDALDSLKEQLNAKK